MLFRSMKKFFVVLGVLFLALVVAGGAFIGWSAWQGGRLDASSRAYVEANVPPILRTWSKDEMMSRASPQMRGDMEQNDDALDAAFARLATLGAFQRFDDVQGQSQTFFDAGKGRIVGATYTGSASFEHGQAKVAVRLIRLDGQWKMQAFNVSSPSLTQQASPP